MRWAKCDGIQAAQNQPIYRIFKEPSVRLGAEMFGSGQFLSAGLVTTAEALDSGHTGQQGRLCDREAWQ
jgi:hypothetical protein